MSTPCPVTALERRSFTGSPDGLPTALLVAMAVPTISTRILGIPEIVGYGRSGLLVDPRLQCQLGAAGRRKAEEAFDVRKNVALLRAYFASSARPETLTGGEVPHAYRLYRRG